MPPDTMSMLIERRDGFKLESRANLAKILVLVAVLIVFLSLAFPWWMMILSTEQRSETHWVEINPATGGEWIKHSLGREEIYDPLSRLYFIFWSDTTSRIFYNWSSNGYVWHNGDPVVRDPDPVGSAGGKFYVNTGIIGKTSYVYYVRCNEGTHVPIKYRSGEIHSDGSIIWNSESTLASGTNVSQQAVNGICQTPSGYIWASYWCRWDNGTAKYYTTFSQTHSSWATYLGYPKSTFDEIYTEYNEGYIYGINDTSAYIVTTPSNQQGFINGRMIVNHTFQALHNISIYKTGNVIVGGRDFSGLYLNKTSSVYVAFQSASPDTKIRITTIDASTNTIVDKDGIISSSSVDSRSFPILNYDFNFSVLNCNWVKSDGTVWLAQKLDYSSGWKSATKIGSAPTGMTFYVDPNTVIEYSFGKVVVDFLTTDLGSYKRIWTFCFVPDPNQ